MIDKDKSRDSAAKGPKKRNPACVQLRADVVIPKGTILRQDPGKAGQFTCHASYGTFIVEGMDVHHHAGIYKMVISA